MKENKLPISLSQLLFNVPEPDFRPTRSSLLEMVFDARHDFTLTMPDPKLAVWMTFANERCLEGDGRKGVRRSVLVTLSDATNQKLLASASVSVNIKGGEYCYYAQACLPIVFDEVDFTHPYKVTVTDRKSGQILGDRELRFFHQFIDRYYISEIFKPFSAGFGPYYVHPTFKSFNADISEYSYVCFHLSPEESITLPPFIPEMEVRIYFPDGTVESKFVTPELDEGDSYLTTYHVAAPFYMTQLKKGICYAELISFDIPIAGFVFNTDSYTVFGPWYVPDIDPLDEYSLDEATERYKKSIDDNSGETKSTFTDDDFENALQSFISSEQEHDKSMPEETEQTEESTDDTPDPVIEPISPLKALDCLTGLHAVKEKLQAYEKVVKFNKMRLDNNLPANSLPLHAMFLGSPGTGKTTVAKRMGLMLHRAGVLSKGHVVIKERATLLGPNYSMEESNTLEAIEQAQGGILFIDEAYQLYQPSDPRDPGKFVIEALMTALADESKRDWMLILAGYPDEMKRMFEMNPGFKSRIPESNIYIFDDFSEGELMEIAERYLERNSYSLSPEARLALSKRLAGDYASRGKDFGNARHVLNMIQTEILPAMAVRVMSESNINAEMLSLIQPSDIPNQMRKLQPQRPHIGYRA